MTLARSPSSLALVLRSSTAALVVLAIGCVAQLTPSVFRVHAQKGTLEQVQRALAQHGGVDDVDANAGIARTPWESSGQNRDGTIWAYRYIVTLAPEGAMSAVTVAMDLRTCRGALGTNPHTGRLDATSCTRLPEGTTPAMYQDQLDRFATSLHTALR